MPLKYPFISILFFALLAIGCSNSVQIPKLEFVSLRHSQLQDTALFKDMTYPFFILRFSSDMELEKCEPNTAHLLLYASAQRQGFNYNDLIQNDGTREEGVISTVSIKRVQIKKEKYYYDAAFYLSLSKKEFVHVNDRIYCKIFFMKMFEKAQETEEMDIPKDSLGLFLN